MRMKLQPGDSSVVRGYAAETLALTTCPTLSTTGRAIRNRLSVPAGLRHFAIAVCIVFCRQLLRE